MTRTLTSLASTDSEKLLNVLIDSASDHGIYRDAMNRLGQMLAATMLKEVALLKKATVCIACTVEDADFLAKGILDGLVNGGVDASHLKLVCFWNERVSTFSTGESKFFDVAPIIKSYREEVDLDNAIIVVVKSIISGACVVKTNLMALIDRTVPNRVLVVAPVMLKGAEQRLASEFPVETSSKFEYFSFAVDDTKSEDGEFVLPGIGGSVYERLGFEDSKNSYVPEIVRHRRARRAGLSTV